MELTTGNVLSIVGLTFTGASAVIALSFFAAKLAEQLKNLTSAVTRLADVTSTLDTKVDDHATRLAVVEAKLRHKATTHGPQTTFQPGPPDSAEIKASGGSDSDVDGVSGPAHGDLRSDQQAERRGGVLHHASDKGHRSPEH